MAYEVPSSQLRETVHDWLLNGPSDAELAVLGDTLDQDLPFDETDWPPRGVRRSAAVFHVPDEYIVIVDDGVGQPLRSWNVAPDLVEQDADGNYYKIPGPENRDDIIVPYDPYQVAGGLGSAVLESCDVVAYALRLGQLDD